MPTLVFTNPGSLTDTSLPILRRDDLLAGDSNGVRFLFDLANTYCYVAGAPTAGKAVKDVAAISADGVIVNPTSQLAAGGNGLDFSSVADGLGNRSGLTIPNSVMADLWTLQQFLVCYYVKMPASGDWTTTNGLNTMGFSSGGDWGSNGELFQAGFVGTGTISAGYQVYRQSARGSYTAVTTGSSANTTHGGRLTQVGVWRTAAGALSLRLKSSGGTTLATNATAPLNTDNFSAVTHGFGNLGSFGQYGVSTWGNNLRLYRGFIENLATSGRDPATVLDADYTRTLARAVYT